MSTRGWLEAQIEALTIECGKRQAEVERLKKRNAERERAMLVHAVHWGAFNSLDGGVSREVAELYADRVLATKGDA